MNKEDKVTIIEEDTKYEEGNETKQLVFKHLDRLSRYMFSGEPNPNYTEDGKGQIMKKADRRMVIIGAIDFLICLVIPHYDEEMKKRHDKFKEDLKTIYFETQLHLARIRAKLFVDKWEKGGEDKSIKNYLKEVEAIAKELLKNNSGGFFLNRESDDWEEYLDRKLDCYMQVLEDINFLLVRKNWLSQTDYEE